jgi:hypothetical protein
MASTAQGPMALEHNVLQAAVSGTLTDIRGQRARHPDLYDPDPARYPAAQAWAKGAAARARTGSPTPACGQPRAPAWPCSGPGRCRTAGSCGRCTTSGTAGASSAGPDYPVSGAGGRSPASWSKATPTRITAIPRNMTPVKCSLSTRHPSSTPTTGLMYT